MVNLRVASQGNPTLRDSINVYTQVGSSIAEDSEMSGINPQGLILHVSPNPFREKTEITYSVGRSAKGIALKIYNVTGQLVKSFRHTPNALRSTQISWDGTNNHGVHVTTGVYFIKLIAGNHSLIQKVTLIK